VGCSSGSVDCGEVVEVPVAAPVRRRDAHRVLARSQRVRRLSQLTDIRHLSHDHATRVLQLPARGKVTAGMLQLPECGESLVLAAVNAECRRHCKAVCGVDQQWIGLMDRDVGRLTGPVEDVHVGRGGVIVGQVESSYADCVHG